MSSVEAQIAELRKIVQKQAEQIQEMKQDEQSYYSSTHARTDTLNGNIPMPDHGRSPEHALRLIQDVHELDFKERLNTSSYVNVVFEAEEEEVVKMGMRINLADQTVYPSSYKLHDTCVNMCANLWNCPEPSDFAEKGVHAGAQCVGSTEACLLAGLCMKFRWREWYQKKHGLTNEQVYAVRPNMVIGCHFQAAWEKLFKYMDIEPKLADTSIKTFSITPQGVRKCCDDKTIGVVCILGNHYGGHYDPVWDISKELTKLNKEKGWKIGIHIDGASGAFIAPWQPYLPPWDFRLDNVLSISASGHKFGESLCGTGWVVWRQREDLSSHVAISVAYLGGQGESYTLNFSRPASGVYVQFYKLMRLGMLGYAQLESNMMGVAKYIRDKMKAMSFNKKPRFQMLDAGDTGCLPVVAARLNPDSKFTFDDIDFQHAIALEHWYVSGYALSMTHPVSEEKQKLFFDAEMDETMFRIVVKSNLTHYLADDLIHAMNGALEKLDRHQAQKCEVTAAALAAEQSAGGKNAKAMGTADVEFKPQPRATKRQHKGSIIC
jgi:glutamate decarboxylase